MTNSATPLFAEEFLPPAGQEISTPAQGTPSPLAAPGSPTIFRLLRRLDRQPATLLWLEVLALVLVLGFADYVTGYEVNIVLFYSVPILMMVRFADKEAATLVALLCTLIWWWADEACGHHYTTAWHQVWETSVRVIYLLLTVAGGVVIKSRIELLHRSRKLEHEIVRVSEHERHRLGQDLHDGLCQYYAAVGFSAGSIKARLERAGSPESEAVRELQELILDGVQQTRALARGLFPVQNDDWGLPSALTELCGSTRRLLNVACTFSSNASTAPIRNDCSTHLFRIAQEAVSNAVRHGRATTIFIRLDFSETSLTLSIEDNGIGFGPPQPGHRGMGLTIMQYRARQMGGNVTFTNQETGCATVTCHLPLDAVHSDP